MGRGPKKHLKRLAAPKHWMLDKLTGSYAPRPSPGPHKKSECLPLILFLRNRLKYALTGREVQQILMQRLIKVDGKVRTDPKFPSGYMDVISIEKTGEHFRLVYDSKGRYLIHRIKDHEAEFKLCKVTKVEVGKHGIPYLATHDGRTIRFYNPAIKVNDSVKVNIATGKISDYAKMEVGNVCMITGGHNIGRVGVITSRDVHVGGFDIIHVKDSRGNAFATRLGNIFILGKGVRPWVTLPAGNGIRKTQNEEQERHRQLKLQGKL